MVLSGWNAHLDLLYPNSIRYQHHQENLRIEDLRIKKRPAFKSVSNKKLKKGSKRSKCDIFL